MSSKKNATESIGVIGVGYVGLVTAACFAARGFDVVCRDIDQDKVALLKRGVVPIHEPGLAELVTEHLAKLRFTTDLDVLFERAKLAFVCVDTPPTVSGDADLSRVQAVIDAIPAAAGGAVLVMKSTVPVGTGRRLRAELNARGLDDVGYVSNPEFLREGTAISDFMRPDRVVIGAERPADGDRVARLYAGFDCPVVRTDVPSAEMVKLASNAFLATKISFVNEIANVCDEVGADVEEVARGMGLDPRIGASFLRPGVGYGGSCLVGEETVLMRRDGVTRLVELRALFAELEDEQASHGASVIEPEELEVLAWDAEHGARFHPVAAATRRRFEGELVTLRTEMGRRLRCTPDHPFVVAGEDGRQGLEWAGRLTTQSALPLVEDWRASSRPGDRDGTTVTAPATTTWVRVVDITRAPFAGDVYSLEVPGPHTFVTTGGLVTHNCFPKDVSALKQLAGNTGYAFQLLAAVIEVNELQKRRVVTRLQRDLGNLRDRRIALLGLAFKPNTDDMREASSLVLAGRLVSEGASVVTYDPIAAERARPLLPPTVEIAGSMLEAMQDADATVIVTEWDEFRRVLDPAARDRMRGNLLIDGRNMLDPAAAVEAGYVYRSVGRPQREDVPASV